MFKKEFRLPKGNFKGERVLSSPFYILKIARSGKPFSRFGIVISKKIDKRAVARNRAKRKLRSCIESNMTNIIGGLDFLFIFKKLPDEDEYCKIFLSQFKKEKLLTI